LIFEGVREIVPGFQDPVGECEPPVLIVRGGLRRDGISLKSEPEGFNVNMYFSVELKCVKRFVKSL
jgi:hypothetical protein